MAVHVYLPKTAPDQWQPGESVLVDSDALSNAHAILEIERWSRDRGLRRTNEQHLRVVTDGSGTMWRRATCYLPRSEELVDEKERAEAMLAELEERLARQPMTTSSAELLREGE